jgi:hypothetical protein
VVEPDVVGRGVVEPEVVEPEVVGPDDVGRDVVGRDVVGPDDVEPDVVRRGDATLGILSFWPTYTHELTFIPLAIARRCVVIPWRMAIRINVSPGRTMYVPLPVAGIETDVAEPDVFGRDVVGLDDTWPGMRSLLPAYNHAFWLKPLAAANWLTLMP